jgi:hypothetical protein
MSAAADPDRSSGWLTRWAAPGAIPSAARERLDQRSPLRAQRVTSAEALPPARAAVGNAASRRVRRAKRHHVAIVSAQAR